MVTLLKDKLVRDRIPEIIREKDGKPEVRVASKDELDVLLREKIVEEAQEFLFSGDSEELVDIQEAIDALIKLRKTDPAMLELQRHTKLLARGGFSEGYVLVIEEESE